MIVLKDMVVERKRGLAPCPLCDNEAVFVHYLGGVFIKCTCCECMVAKQISTTTETILPFQTEEEAKKVWNRRNGVMEKPKYMMDKATPQEILAKRDKRVQKILAVLKNRKGEYVLMQDIMDGTGLTRSVINNTIQYMKKKYPEIKTKHGSPGYCWED